MVRSFTFVIRQNGYMSLWIIQDSFSFYSLESVTLKVIIRHLSIFLHRMLPFYPRMPEERPGEEASFGGDALP